MLGSDGGVGMVGVIGIEDSWVGTESFLWVFYGVYFCIPGHAFPLVLVYVICRSGMKCVIDYR